VPAGLTKQDNFGQKQASAEITLIARNIKIVLP
jgi:hypothetical protein